MLTIHADLTLVFKIAFVRNDDNGERVLIFDSEDLLVEGADFLERVARCDRIDEEETFTGAHILLAHSTVSSKIHLVIACADNGIYDCCAPVFFLSCRVQHIKKCDLLVDYALFSVRVWLDMLASQVKQLLR